MSRRITKQFLYGLLYLSFWCLVGLWVYVGFIRPAPGCQNNRQDAGEEGVDCGGVCATACLPATLKSIETIGSVRLFHPNPQTLEVAAKIQNANSGFSAKSFTYHFNIFDAAGNQVDSVAGDSFIYAGEIKYLAGIKTGISYAPANVELVIDEPTWVTVAEYPRPSLGGIQGKRVQVTSSTIEVSGTISNRDVVTVHNISLVAVFYDSLGLPAGISHTELDSLAPEETKPFSIFHPAIEDLLPDQTDIFVSAQRQ